MKCIVCRHGETKAGMTTVTFHREGRTLVVNAVPAEVCENCGEPYVSGKMTARLLRMADEARDSRAAVVVRDFSPAAA